MSTPSKLSYLEFATLGRALDSASAPGRTFVTSDTVLSRLARRGLMRIDADGCVVTADGVAAFRRHQEAVRYACTSASMHLGNANEAREAGKSALAAKLDRKAQFWHDRYNDLTGSGS